MTVSANNELYWDCGGLHDTPPLEAVEVRRQPSLSPPLDIPSPEATSDSSPSPQSYRPSLGDGVLIHFMDDGKNPDIAAHASQVPLAGDDKEDNGHHSNRGATAVNDVEKGMHRPSPAAFAQGAAWQSQITQELAADNAAQREVGGERIDEIRPPISSTASTHASDTRRPPFLDTSLKQEVRTLSPGGQPHGNGIGPVTLSVLVLGDPSHYNELNLSFKLTSRETRETVEHSNDARDLIPREETLPGKQHLSNSKLEGRELGITDYRQIQYGCTFLNCSKTFNNKTDWKRHENSTHFYLKQWRCDQEYIGGVCAKVCYRKKGFLAHLEKDHKIFDIGVIKKKVDNCYMAKNCQIRFWCGFCNKLIDLKKKGMDAWTERFDHIDDHFVGRGCFKKQSIRDWTPVDSGKSKMGVEVAHTLNSLSAIKDHSDYDSSGNSSESTVRGDNYRGTKRKLCNNNGGNHQSTKRGKRVIKGRKLFGRKQLRKDSH